MSLSVDPPTKPHRAGHCSCSGCWDMWTIIPWVGFLPSSPVSCLFKSLFPPTDTSGLLFLLWPGEKKRSTQLFLCLTACGVKSESVLLITSTAPGAALNPVALIGLEPVGRLWAEWRLHVCFHRSMCGSRLVFTFLFVCIQLLMIFYMHICLS